jgi:hypothetical protein
MAMKHDLSPGEIDALINQLEQRMTRLRSLYEQYFMGIERIPPHTLRKEVVRIVFQLEQAHVQNTAMKFRIRSLVQRFNSYKTYWNRTERQIEEGTYKRDRARAARNQRRREEREQYEDDMHVIDLELEEVESLQDYQRELEALDAAGAFDSVDRSAGSNSGAESGADAASSVREEKLARIKAQLQSEAHDSSATAPAAGASSGASSASTQESKLDAARAAKLAKLKQRLNKQDDLPTGGASVDKLREMAAHRERLKQQQGGRTIHRNSPPPRSSSDDQARAVYNQLLEAKKRCNEPTSNLSYESVQKSMQKQREQLRSSRGARDVDFKVVIKDGKAFLKPVPK